MARRGVGWWGVLDWWLDEQIQQRRTAEGIAPTVVVHYRGSTAHLRQIRRGIAFTRHKGPDCHDGRRPLARPDPLGGADARMATPVRWIVILLVVSAADLIGSQSRSGSPSRHLRKADGRVAITRSAFLGILRIERWGVPLWFESSQYRFRGDWSAWRPRCHALETICAPSLSTTT